MNRQFLIIGDLSGRRIKAFTDCLNKYGIDNYKILSWLDIARDMANFTKNLQANMIVKLEPPEKDMEIYRAFLKLGVCPAGLNKQEIDQLDFSRYQIVAPQQWYMGFCTLLENMERAAKQHSHNHTIFMHDLQATLTMLDKRATYKVLAANASNYTYYLPENLVVPQNYQEFAELYHDKFIKCFIKLRYGSGGTGVLAYSNNPKLAQQIVYTSLYFEHVAGKRLFFSRSKVYCVRDKAVIKALIDWVLSNGAHIERWLPKPVYQGHAFDTRAFVIHKKAAYLVSRLSKSPITNLHLQNKRMESTELFTKEDLAVISRAAEDVMQVFPTSLYGGIDVVYAHNKPYIIDVNPFGDLFHHLLGTAANVYYLEIEKALALLGGACR